MRSLPVNALRMDTPSTNRSEEHTASLALVSVSPRMPEEPNPLDYIIYEP
jgi:hypothetical protein